MSGSIPAEKAYLPPPEPDDEGKRRVTIVVLICSAALAVLGALLSH